tara:strand:+ start:165 stop:605 length:441 start_codon:yes stop_codon:yes gene_type:complete
MFKFIYNILTLGMYGRLEALRNEIIKNTSSITQEYTNDIDTLNNKVSDMKNEISLEVESAINDYDFENAITNSFSLSDFDLLDECDIEQRIEDAKDDVRDDIQSVDDIQNIVSDNVNSIIENAISEEIKNYHAIGEGKSFTITRKE